jgi:hypothetical protein
MAIPVHCFPKYTPIIGSCQDFSLKNPKWLIDKGLRQIEDLLPSLLPILGSILPIFGKSWVVVILAKSFPNKTLRQTWAAPLVLNPYGVST